MAQAGEAMERLHEQRPDDGFFSLDNYVMYHHLHFGMPLTIIHEGLLAALEKNATYEWAEKYRYYVGKLISVYRRSARMERIIASGSTALDFNESIVVRVDDTHDDHERPHKCFVPLEGVVFDFESMTHSASDITDRGIYTGGYLVRVSAVEGYDGPQWYRQLGHRGNFSVSFGGHVTKRIEDLWG